MPSERRQRQQRVRHEVGDYDPNAQSNAAVDHEAKEEIANINSQVVSNTQYENKAPNQCTSEFRRKDERKHNDRYERGRAPGNRGRGRGRPDTNAAVRSETRQNTNVAIEEKREYEPVMIMDSKTGTDAKQINEIPQPVKYQRSEVISNWLRYDELPPEEELNDGEDYLLGEDFSQVLSLNVNKTSGGFLHLKGEVSWGNLDKSQLGSHGLGALKVSDLIAALGTIAFHEQLKIPAESLPAFTVSTFKACAEKNKKTYRPDQEYVTDIEINQKLLDSLKLSETEPLRLSTEEPVSFDKHNAIDAALKFSSAFKPEPTDIDLDTLENGEDTSVQCPLVRVTMEEVSSLPEMDSRKNNVTKVQKDTIQVERKDFAAASPKIENDWTVPQSESKTPHDDTNKEQSFNIPKFSSSVATPSTNVNFNFGLPKINNNVDSSNTCVEEVSSKPVSSKKKNKNRESAKKELEPKKNVDQTINVMKEPKIDLDQPINVQKEAPVLVKKTEVENLEDWLDSVLDD